MPPPLRQTNSDDEIRRLVVDARCRGKRVGIIPTMGALHAGHLSLVAAARAECDLVVVTIFVNPAQFGPGEDFEAYPRDLAGDLEMLAEQGADLVFTPATETIYLPDHQTYVVVGAVAESYEGAVRPVHFRGVAGVGRMILLLDPADVAYFGQLWRRPARNPAAPPLRQPDGLAFSARNAYLSPADRRQAAVLYRALSAAARLRVQGERNADRLRSVVREQLQAGEGVTIDYVAILADGTMREVEQVEGPVVAAAAIRLGGTRLLDNLRIE